VRARYLLLSGALFLLLSVHSWTDAWRGDFWIYLATVNEVATSPGRPSNPLFANAYPFAFFSPYTVGLGLVSRLTHLSPLTVLLLQGLLNLLFLLGSLYAFTVVWLRRPAAAFYALLFLLFLWGRDPWVFSSVFHLRSLALVLPYPSTFAAALALGLLAAFPGALHSPSKVKVALGLLASVVLLIVHPVNALFLWLGLFVYSLSAARPFRLGALLALGLGASLALALAWPLVPLGDLWFGQIAAVHEGNTSMYDDPLPRIAPALLGVPWLLWRLRRNPRDPLALLALVLAAAVVYGGLFGKWSYGRLLSHAVLLCQIGLADAMAALEERIAVWRRGALLRPLLAPAMAALLVGVSWSEAVRPTIEEAGRGDLLWLSFLQQQVGRDDVVLTDLERCWYIPAFRGRVVAYPMHIPFVPDHDQRVRAVERFFERGTPDEERREILKRYDVAFLLVPKPPATPEQAGLDELRPLGRTVYANADYELLRTAR
jgi:alpha-1,6-mannosyltransferase